MSQEKKKENWFETGHINAELIKQKVPEFKEAVFYICGPEGMKEKITKELLKAGVHKSKIKSESFFW